MAKSSTGKTKVRGITIELSVDASEVTKQIADVNQKMKSTSTALRDVDRLLKLDPTNTVLLRQKTELLKQEISNTTEKLDALKLAQKDMDENGVAKNSEQYQALTREIEATKIELQNLKNEAGSGSATMAVISAKTGAAGEAMENAGEKMLPVSVAIAAVGAAAVKTTADFDAQMSRVAAISGATGEEFDVLRDKAREMGSKTKFTATEAGEAFEYMAMAGWKSEDMLKGIDGIMNLAAASGEELGTTSDIVTDALTAFGMSAEESGHFADILAAASTNANTNVSLLGESFKYAAPVAGALGYSAEDVSVALGLMANSGIKASQAGTSLRSLMTRMAKPTKESAEAMEELGISLTDSDGRMLSFQEIMDQLRASFGQMSMPIGDFNAQVAQLDAGLEDGTLSQEEYDAALEELTAQAYGAEGAEKARLAAMLAGKTGMSGLLAIVNASSEDYEQLTNAVAHSSDTFEESGQVYSGTAEHMAAVMQDNLSGQFTILMSQLQELAISIGDIIVPIIRDVVSGIQGVVDWLNNLDEGTKETIVTIAGIVAAIAPLLIVGGKVLTGISKITGALSTVGGTTFGPIGMVIAAGAALIGVLAGFVTAAEDAYFAASPFTEELNNLKTANDDLKDSIDGAKAAYDESVTSAEANAGAAGALYDKILELTGAYDGSVESQETIKALVEELNELVPDLGLAWDETTNSLNLNTEEIYNQINAMKAQAKVAALQEFYTESLKEQYAAQKNVSDAQTTLNKLLDQYGLTLDDYLGVIQGDAAAQAKFNEAMWNGAANIAEVEARSKETADAFVAYGVALDNSKTVAENVAFAESELGNAMEEAARAATSSCNAIEDRYLQTFGTTMPETLKQAIDAAAEAGVKVPQNIVDGVMSGQMNVHEAARQITALLDTREEAAETGEEVAVAYTEETATVIKKQGPGITDAAEDAVAGLDQTDAATDYGSDVAEAYTGEASRKIIYSEEIGDAAEDAVSGLDQGTSAYSYGNDVGEQYDEGFGSTSGSITSTVDDVWNIYYQALGVTLKGKMWEWGYNAAGKLKSGLDDQIESITNKAADIVTGIENKLQQLKWKLESYGYQGGTSLTNGLVSGIKYIYNTAYNSGFDAGNGFYNGLYAWADSIRTLAWNIAVDAANEARAALDINSPSRVMQQIGEYAGEGMALGLEESAGSITDAMMSLTGNLTNANAGISALNASAMSANSSYAQAQTNALEFGNIAGLLAQYLPYLAQKTNIVLDDGTLAGHMAPAMNDALSVLADRAARG